MDLIDALEAASGICQKAGLDPDQTLTRFTIADIAAALLDSGMAEAEIVRILPQLYLPRLADALVEASHWNEVIPDWVSMQDLS